MTEYPSGMPDNQTPSPEKPGDGFQSQSPFGTSRPIISEPEHASSWIMKIISDTVKGFIHSPFHICIAAVVLVIPVIFTSEIDFSKLMAVDSKGMFDFTYLQEHGSDLALTMILVLFANSVAYSLAYRWANYMRLGKSLSLGGYLEGLASVPRVLFGLVFEIGIMTAALLVTAPVFLLVALSKLFMMVGFMVFFGVLIYLILKWAPKFDYFIAGLGITDEPFSVLLHEWWAMPKWLWRRFLALMAIRILALLVSIIITLPLSVALKNSQYVNLIPNFLIDIVGLIYIASTAVAFARGRDEWAEQTIELEAETEKAGT